MAERNDEPPQPGRPQEGRAGNRGRPSRGRGRGGRGGRGARGARGGNGGRGGGPNPSDDQPAGLEAQGEGPPPVLPAANEVGDAAAARGRGGRGGRGRGAGGRGRGGAGQQSVVVSHGGGRAPRPRGAPLSEDLSARSGLSAAAPEFVPGQPAQPSSSSRPGPGPQQPRQPKAHAPPPPPKSTAPDLPTRIHEDIRNGQYECVICTGEVLPKNEVWSCTICWTVTHRRCAVKWSEKQEQERRENPRPNQPEAGWRCPGCNSNLVEHPGRYQCWCGKDTHPKHIPGLPPHSCGQTCAKSRTKCPHPCPLICHAGPCPPCTLMGPAQSCFCGKNTASKRCVDTDYSSGWSCQEPCGDLLGCGEHECTQMCHAGLCEPCEVPMPSRCYCGKEKRETVPCSQRDQALESFDHGEWKTSSEEKDSESGTRQWFEGEFRCKSTCGRAFDCGIHTCQKLCHPQDELAAHCPLSPDTVTHCPCGKTRLDSMSAEPRRSCQDPVPHCDRPCDAVLACGHRCPDTCHTGACKPCTQHMDIACRCGRTVSRSACHQGNVEHPHCRRVCKTLLNCGRHECAERCCSGEKAAMERRKQKRTAYESFEPEHICLQICGRQLKCGKHNCQHLCHKGPCMSCPEAIFDEISCRCGRTRLFPPQPCGTQPPECQRDCTLPRPCGHPSAPHHCHPEDVPCPRCAFLTPKLCVCGKETLRNQPCWLEEAHCGRTCGKKLKCGTHTCRKTCHKPGECEDADIPGLHCTQPCSKNRKSCGHVCEDKCHFPHPCKEDKPCQSKVFITCPCQHRKQEVRCQASKFAPSPARTSAPLECDDECLRLQRNQKLAAALEIDPATHTDDHIPYSDITLKRFRDQVSWAQQQERELRVFAAAEDEKRMRFKPMPSHQRAFLHALAEDFGLDSESQDPEPHRHVCIFKTPRFVSAPHKTLAQCLRLARTAAGLGTNVSSLGSPTAAAAGAQPQPSRAFNALLLENPRFGLTVDELEAALSKELAAASRSGPALAFTTSFLPSEEVLITAEAKTSAAAIASALAPTPQAIESTVSALKAAVGKTVAREGLAGAVKLCRAEGAEGVTRREGESAAGGSGGWNAVARGGGSWRKTLSKTRAAVPAAQSERPVARSFVVLGRLEGRKKAAAAADAEVEKALEKEVAEDWLAAAEEEEMKAVVEQEGAGGVEGESSHVGGVDGQGSVEDGESHVLLGETRGEEIAEA